MTQLTIFTLPKPKKPKKDWDKELAEYRRLRELSKLINPPVEK